MVSFTRQSSTFFAVRDKILSGKLKFTVTDQNLKKTCESSRDKDRDNKNTVSGTLCEEFDVNIYIFACTWIACLLVFRIAFYLKFTILAKTILPVFAS